MKAHYRNWIRARRALALAGCLTAAALPATAGAMQLGPHPVRVIHENTAAPDQIGAKLDHRGLDRSDPYTLPAGFKTDAQTVSRAPATQPYTLPSGFKSDVQSAPPSSSTPSSSPVVREIRNVVHDGSRTLAIVLAAAALGIALAGTGYAMVRLTRVQRRIFGSSS